ncbi:HAD-like protein [Hypoxylon sp. NC0597]|nr:HAD-like protein [Hypoxylon sp. NC0597]
MMSASGRENGEAGHPVPHAPLNPDTLPPIIRQYLQACASQLPQTSDHIAGQYEADSRSSSYSPPPAIPPEPSHSPSTLTNDANDTEGKPMPRKQDAIVPPSAASGGVPNPTQQYLTNASLPPFVLPQERQILVVIDLNGTLLHRPDSYRPTYFVERPHARSFLNYCIETFKVVIWSSAKSQNVEKMCRQLLKPKQFWKVVAIWGRESFGLSDNDYRQRVQCYKRLSLLWSDEKIAASHPEADKGKRWSQADTVLIDDSIEKARSEPYNLVRVPEYDGDLEKDGEILPQVHDYINELARTADISTFIRSRPFEADLAWRLPDLPTPHVLTIQQPKPTKKKKQKKTQNTEANEA